MKTFSGSRRCCPGARSVQILSHATVFACPSIYEPLGIVNLEAMACETAVVATATGGIVEVVDDGVTGLLVPIEAGDATGEPRDPDAFARAFAEGLNELVRDPARAADMVVRCGRVSTDGALRVAGHRAADGRAVRAARGRVNVSLLAQLSDPHVRVGRDDGASARALSAAVDSVLAFRPVPQAVLVTGDIADAGEAREYERPRELLAPLTMPVHVLPGNHDDRDGLREHFGLAADARGAPVQYTAGSRDLRVVVCDSTRPGRDDGTVAVDWLHARLAEEPDTPTIVAMHHVPLTIGLPVLDAIGVPPEETRALGELLARSPQVRRVVAGHVHRTVVGSLGGCAVLACTSNYEQARLEIGAPDLRFVSEPPAFALHVLLEGELVSHMQPLSA